MRRCGEDGSQVEVVVDDAGPGVAPEERERIFERFVRGGSRGSLPGTGLGLSLVAETMRAHHGTVHVDDAPGGGARFVMRLPLASGGRVVTAVRRWDRRAVVGVLVVATVFGCERLRRTGFHAHHRDRTDRRAVPAARTAGGPAGGVAVRRPDGGGVHPRVPRP